MPKPRLSAADKQRLVERTGGYCEYCRSRLDHTPSPSSVEHIVPLSKGGDNAEDNLALSCQGCNNKKYTKTTAVDPESGKRVTLFHPRRQMWSEHFGWSNDFLLIVGITPTGRATIECLDLNREGVINFRRALLALGVTPPQ